MISASSPPKMELLTCVFLCIVYFKYHVSYELHVSCKLEIKIHYQSILVSGE